MFSVRRYSSLPEPSEQRLLLPEVTSPHNATGHTHALPAAMAPERAGTPQRHAAATVIQVRVV